MRESSIPLGELLVEFVETMPDGATGSGTATTTNPQDSDADADVDG